MSARTPRQPVAPPPQIDMAARTRWAEPAENGWVDLKEAARRAGVSQRTMYRHCSDKAVVARKLFRGKGPWRVRLDKDGYPMDADSPQASSQ